MSFTTCNNVTLVEKGTWEYQDNWMNRSFFYKKDIDLVWAQPGVEAVEIMKAIVNGQETLVLVGVKIYKDSQNDMTIRERLNQEKHFVALLCPPFQRAGGEYLDFKQNGDKQGGTPGIQDSPITEYR